MGKVPWNGALAGTIQMKVGKPCKDGMAAVKATVIGKDGEKKSLKATGKSKVLVSTTGPTTISLVGGDACEVTLGAKDMGGAIDLGGAAATVDSLYTDATGGSFVGDVTLTGTLTVDVRGAQTIASPLTVDGDVTLSDAKVNFQNYTNIEPERGQTFLTATGTATGDFARDNLTGPYRRRKSGSSYALVHSSGMTIIFR